MVSRYDFVTILALAPDVTHCIGNNTSGGPCTSLLAQTDLDIATRLLNQMNQSANLFEALNDIRQVAELLLCKDVHNSPTKLQHSQVETVIGKWKHRIELEDARLRKREIEVRRERVDRRKREDIRRARRETREKTFPVFRDFDGANAHPIVITRNTPTVSSNTNSISRSNTHPQGPGPTVSTTGNIPRNFSMKRVSASNHTLPLSPLKPIKPQSHPRPHSKSRSESHLFPLSTASSPWHLEDFPLPPLTTSSTQMTNFTHGLPTPDVTPVKESRRVREGHRSTNSSGSLTLFPRVDMRKSSSVRDGSGKRREIIHANNNTRVGHTLNKGKQRQHVLPEFVFPPIQTREGTQESREFAINTTSITTTIRPTTPQNHKASISTFSFSSTPTTSPSKSKPRVRWEDQPTSWTPDTTPTTSNTIFDFSEATTLRYSTRPLPALPALSLGSLADTAATTTTVVKSQDQKALAGREVPETEVYEVGLVLASNPAGIAAISTDIPKRPRSLLEELTIKPLSIRKSIQSPITQSISSTPHSLILRPDNGDTSSYPPTIASPRSEEEEKAWQEWPTSAVELEFEFCNRENIPPITDMLSPANVDTQPTACLGGKGEITEEGEKSSPSPHLHTFEREGTTNSLVKLQTADSLDSSTRRVNGDNSKKENLIPSQQSSSTSLKQNNSPYLNNHTQTSYFPNFKRTKSLREHEERLSRDDDEAPPEIPLRSPHRSQETLPSEPAITTSQSSSQLKPHLSLMPVPTSPFLVHMPLAASEKELAALTLPVPLRSPGRLDTTTGTASPNINADTNTNTPADEPSSPYKHKYTKEDYEDEIEDAFESASPSLPLSSTHTHRESAGYGYATVTLRKKYSFSLPSSPSSSSAHPASSLPFSPTRKGKETSTTAAEAEAEEALRLHMRRKPLPPLPSTLPLYPSSSFDVYNNTTHPIPEEDESASASASSSSAHTSSSFSNPTSTPDSHEHTYKNIHNRNRNRNHNQTHESTCTQNSNIFANRNTSSATAFATITVAAQPWAWIGVDASTQTEPFLLSFSPVEDVNMDMSMSGAVNEQHYITGGNEEMVRKEEDEMMKEEENRQMSIVCRLRSRVARTMGTRRNGRTTGRSSDGGWISVGLRV